MKKVVLIIITLWHCIPSMGIDLHRTIGGRAVAMGHAGACERSVWSLQNNPAGIALIEGCHFGLYYENQWFLKETAYKSGAAVKSIPKAGSIGLLVNQFGGSNYSESLFGLAYARAFGPYLQMGLRCDYILLHWGDSYPHRGGFSFMLGMQSQLTERLRVGACLAHPLQRMHTLHEDRFSTVMRFGLSYCFTNEFTGQCEMERDNSRKGIRLKTGIEYEIFKKFRVRAGAQHNPNLLSFGAGYQLKGLEVDVGAEMHTVLGMSIQVGIIYKVGGQ